MPAQGGERGEGSSFHPRTHVPLPRGSDLPPLPMYSPEDLTKGEYESQTRDTATRGETSRSGCTRGGRPRCKLQLGDPPAGDVVQAHTTGSFVLVPRAPQRTQTNRPQPNDRQGRGPGILSRGETQHTVPCGVCGALQTKQFVPGDPPVPMTPPCCVGEDRLLFAPCPYPVSRTLAHQSSQVYLPRGRV